MVEKCFCNFDGCNLGNAVNSWKRVYPKEWTIGVIDERERYTNLESVTNRSLT